MKLAVIDLPFSKRLMVASCRAAIEAIESGMPVPERERAVIHALTRKFTMSDEDCSDLAMELSGMYSGEITPVLQDLRDRYEECGRYAPPRSCG